MPMKMFRVLVLTEVRDNAAGSRAVEHLPGHGTNNIKEAKQFVAGEPRVEKRRDMALGHDNDVDGVKRPCVIEGQDLIGLQDRRDRRVSAKDLVTVEVARCRFDVAII